MKWLKIALPLLALIFVAFVFKNAGHWLVIDQPVKKADVIIVLGGDDTRAESGMNLYRRGYAPYLILSGMGDSTPWQAVAIREGIPEEAVIIEARARSTYENALYTKALMQQHGFRSAIVVSSNYHMLRSMLTFSKVFDGTGAAFTFSSVKDLHFNPGRWWSSGRNIRHILREYGGIAALYLGLESYITSSMAESPPLSFFFRL